MPEQKTINLKRIERAAENKWVIPQYIFAKIVCTFAAVTCEKSTNLHGNQEDNHCFPIQTYSNKTD